jgi:hypothetical protein
VIDPANRPANVNPRAGYRRTRVLVLGVLALTSAVVITLLWGGVLVGLAYIGIKDVLGTDETIVTRVVALGCLGGSIAIGAVLPRTELDTFRAFRLALIGSRAIATLVEVRRSDGEGGPSWSLRYEYVVDGEQHTNSENWTQRPSAGGEWAAGRHVLIAYDPKRPHRSVML